MLEVGSPKAARELLCELQQLSYGEWSQVTKYGHDLIKSLISQIDQHRPLGPDGKHGNRHTATCGCDPTYPFPLPRDASVGDYKSFIYADEEFLFVHNGTTWVRVMGYL